MPRFNRNPRPRPPGSRPFDLPPQHRPVHQQQQPPRPAAKQPAGVVRRPKSGKDLSRMIHAATWRLAKGSRVNAKEIGRTVDLCTMVADAFAAMQANARFQIHGRGRAMRLAVKLERLRQFKKERRSAAAKKV